MKTRIIRHIGLFALLFLVGLMGTLSAHVRHVTPTPTPQSATATSPTPQADNAASPAPALPIETLAETMPFMVDFPNYHPLIVHFPIVLLIIAAVFQILSFFAYRKEFSMATLLMLVIGAISVWLASNVFHVHAMNLTERANEIFETHELMAKYTFWFAIAGLAAKAVSHFFISRKWWSEAVVLIMLVGASITVSIAGHHGAQLVHMEGVGPQGKYIESHQHEGK